MSSRELEKVGKEPFKGSLFLPKYQRIIEDLYTKAREQNERSDIEMQNIPTIEDLNRLDPSKNIYDEEEVP
jgi:hypothetical protein